MSTDNSVRKKLIRAIRAANGAISKDDAEEFAEAILAFASTEKSELPEVAKAAPSGLVQMTFGKYRGNRIGDCPREYIVFISEIVESKKHTRDMLKCIRAARAYLLETTDLSLLPQDCPFD